MGEGNEGKLFNFLHPVWSRKSDIPPTKENTARGQHRKLLYILIFYSRDEEGWGGVRGCYTHRLHHLQYLYCHKNHSSYITVVTRRQRGLLVKTSVLRLV